MQALAYDALVRASLCTSFGIAAAASAVCRRIYEKQLTPADTVVTRHIPYREGGDPAHTLDVHAPPGKHLPVVVYMHGGAFVRGSKESHWMMPPPFLHMGCIVVNINYRLAPAHPYPAAVEDACRAVAWVIDHIADYGGDPERLVLAGESAGGNLATAVCACMCWERPEPYARALFERGITPSAVLPHAATYSMSKFDHYVAGTPKFNRLVGYLRHVNNYYLLAEADRRVDMTLADPLTLCSPATPPARPLPPFFISSGSLDPLMEDGYLAAACLRGAGAEVETAEYEGGVHVFHALYFTPWRHLKLAVAHWIDTMRFLRRHGLVNLKP